ncbi:type IV pilin [Haloferax sp. Atlit-19N]|uniref:type IV pilin n=1 Tax=Haloferax sp. Atlit-19N TaxID=2077201 RepID=UPI000E22CA4C|nr:type IV pilin N-terminal domain-containing protein [Haloferax sp. Atlit-19N]RDZ47919.1 type IV pilin [Haloferax sp. Atlit-19N]
MQLKHLFTEDRAVSPVIGVILMVAITVILAAVIGTFVLGLGDQVSETSPQASFAFDYNGNGNLTITHESGEQIAANQVTVTGDINNSGQNWTSYGGSDPISAGGSAVVNSTGAQFADGDTVRVVWTSESGSTSSTLQKWTYNG